MHYVKKALDITTIILAIYMVWTGIRFALGTLGTVYGSEFGMLITLVHLVALIVGLGGLLVLRHWAGTIIRS